MWDQQCKSPTSQQVRKYSYVSNADLNSAYPLSLGRRPTTTYPMIKNCLPHFVDELQLYGLGFYDGKSCSQPISGRGCLRLNLGAHWEYFQVECGNIYCWPMSRVFDLKLVLGRWLRESGDKIQSTVGQQTESGSCGTHMRCGFCLRPCRGRAVWALINSNIYSLLASQHFSLGQWGVRDSQLKGRCGMVIGPGTKLLSTYTFKTIVQQVTFSSNNIGQGHTHD